RFEQIINFLNAHPIKYALTVNPIIYTSCVEQFWATANVKNINGEAQPHANVDGKKVVISEALIKRDLQFGDEGETIADEVVNEEMYESLKRATITATSLDEKHDRGNISKTQSKATPNEPSSPKTSSGGGPKRQATVRDTITQTRSENVSNFFNDPPLLRVNTLRTKEIANLKKRVKRLERKRKSISHGLKRLYKVGLSARVESSTYEESLGEEDASKPERISDIDANQDIYLVNVHRDEDIFIVNDPDDTSMFDADKDLQGKEVVVEKEVDGKDVSIVEEINPASITTSVTATTPTISIDEITLAKALIEIKTSRPRQRELLCKSQAEEQEQLTDAKKERLFMDFLEKKRKFFAAKRAKEKRNKPPTKAQQRSLMCIYLKNMDGWKTKALKNK
nr:hypothetical protein [Tanacetum cinerariifolium]